MKRVDREGGQANPRTPFQVGRCRGGQGLSCREALRSTENGSQNCAPGKDGTVLISSSHPLITAELISSPVSVSRGALLVTKEPWGRMVTGDSDRCCQMPSGRGWVLQSRAEST